MYILRLRAIAVTCLDSRSQSCQNIFLSLQDHVSKKYNISNSIAGTW